MHILAQLHGVFLHRLNYLRQHIIICHLYKFLRHIVAKWVHHQLKEHLY